MDALEHRLSTLESRVFGAGPHRQVPDSPLAPQLHDFSRKMGEALHPRDRIAPLMRRTKELETYLQPPIEDVEGALSPALKADLVLAQESQLRETADLLDRLQASKKVLDSEALAGKASELQPRLAKLTHLQLEQVERERELSAETRLRWLSITPFGLPVEPLVYMMMAQSWK